MHSNDSTTSLLASSKKPNGSGLKQSINAPDVADPLEVLGHILGSDEQEPTTSITKVGGSTPVATGDFDFDYDFEGLSLREIALQTVDSTAEPSQTIDECTF